CVTPPGCDCSGTPRCLAAPSSRMVLFDRYSSLSRFVTLLDRLGVARDLTSVALKLNLCEYRGAASGATTSRRFVERVVHALRIHCPRMGRIVLLEQDSSGTR